jgi:hypothetical protein
MLLSQDARRAIEMMREAGNDTAPGLPTTPVATEG